MAEALRRSYSQISEQIVRRAVQALSGADVARQIESLSALPGGRLRDEAIATCLGEWAKDNPTAAYAQIARIPAGLDRDQARMSILLAWAKTDSGGALARLGESLPELQTGLQGSPLVNRVLAQAALQDPRGAAEWAAATLPPGMRIPATVSALNRWADKDAIAALEWAHGHGVPLDSRGFNDTATMYVNDELVRQAVSAGGEKVVDWLRDLPAGAERDHLLTLAANSTRPELSARVFNELSQSAQLQAVGLLGWGKANGDPEAAVRWAREIPSAEVRAEALSTVMREYIERLPSKVDGLLAELPAGSDRDAALLGCAYSAAWRDPEQALGFAARIITPDLREQAFRLAARNWLSRDKTSATAWLAQTPELSEQTKANFLHTD
jgi:hypothetical protein